MVVEQSAIPMKVGRMDWHPLKVIWNSMMLIRDHISPPLTLLDRLTALVPLLPPPRKQRHRYHGVLAPSFVPAPSGPALGPVSHTLGIRSLSLLISRMAAKDPQRAIHKDPSQFGVGRLPPKTSDIFQLQVMLV